MYCTANDLYKRAREDTVKDWITDSVDGPDVDILTEAITWSTNEIDQALMNLYSDHLPFTAATLPNAVKNICVDFAVYWLASRAQAIAETTYLANYKDARARLLRIAEGEEPLVTPTGTTLSASDSIAPDEAESVAYSTTESWTPVFTRESETIQKLMAW